VPVLSNFQGGPAEAGQGSDETGNDAGFSDVTRVSADDDDGHEKAALGNS
jgi:hypothetical protein